MGEEKLQALLQESLAVATRTDAMKASDLARVVIDTTVQPKAVMFPTDAKLLNRARERLVRRSVRRARRIAVPAQARAPAARAGARRRKSSYRGGAQDARCLLEHPRRHHPVARRRSAEEIAVRGAAHQHYAIDGKGEVRHMHLRHVGDEPCTLTDGNGRERASADRHLAGTGRENAEQGLEQCGLAAAVRAEQRQDLAALQRDVEAATDHTIAVADGEVAAGKAHDQVRCIPASSQMKNGVPMQAVRITKGISTGAAVRVSRKLEMR